jgi:hypothetical protein
MRVIFHSEILDVRVLHAFLIHDFLGQHNLVLYIALNARCSKLKFAEQCTII